MFYVMFCRPSAYSELLEMSKGSLGSTSFCASGDYAEQSLCSFQPIPYTGMEGGKVRAAARVKGQMEGKNIYHVIMSNCEVLGAGKAELPPPCGPEAEGDPRCASLPKATVVAQFTYTFNNNGHYLSYTQLPTMWLFLALTFVWLPMFMAHFACPVNGRWPPPFRRTTQRQFLALCGAGKLFACAMQFLLLYTSREGMPYTQQRSSVLVMHVVPPRTCPPLRPSSPAAPRSYFVASTLGAAAVYGFLMVVSSGVGVFRINMSPSELRKNQIMIGSYAASYLMAELLSNLVRGAAALQFIAYITLAIVYVCVVCAWAAPAASGKETRLHTFTRTHTLPDRTYFFLSSAASYLQTRLQRTQRWGPQAQGLRDALGHYCRQYKRLQSTYVLFVGGHAVLSIVELYDLQRNATPYAFRGGEEALDLLIILATWFYVLRFADTAAAWMPEDVDEGRGRPRSRGAVFPTPATGADGELGPAAGSPGDNEQLVLKAPNGELMLATRTEAEAGPGRRAGEEQQCPAPAGDGEAT